MISNISNADINKITSGQVIIDLKSIVKELVENSIDANSKKIEITFTNYGIDQISIVDDGDGISERDFESVCLRSHTSKLVEYDDLDRLHTLGFRGEALHSICSLSQAVKIVTSTKDSYPKTYSLEYNSMGELSSKTVKIGGLSNYGTSLQIEKLFVNLPVRYTNFVKKSKQEFHKAVNFLINYLIIYPEIKFSVYNITNKKNVVLNSRGGAKSSILDNMLTIFGSNGSRGLTPINISIDDNTEIEGYISNHSFGLGRSVQDRQFFFVNRRPTTQKKIQRIINECFKQFNHLQFPVFILNLKINPSSLDVNITPDKMMITIHNESEVLDLIRSNLINFFESQENLVPKNQSRQTQVTNEELEDKTVSNISLSQQNEVSIVTYDEVGEEATPETGHENDGEDEEEESENAENDNEDEDRIKNMESEGDQESDSYNHRASSLRSRKDNNLAVSDAAQSVTEISLREVREQPLNRLTNSAAVVPESEIDTAFSNENNVRKRKATDTSFDSSFPQQTNENTEITELTELFVPELSYEDASFVKHERALDEQMIHSDSDLEKDSRKQNQDHKAKKMTMSSIIGDKSLEPKSDNDSTTTVTDAYGKNFFPVSEEEQVRVSVGGIDDFDSRPNKRVKLPEYVHNLSLSVSPDNSEIFCPRTQSVTNTQSNHVKVENIASAEEQEEKLSYVISKGDFLKMKLIGQFNLGFILVSLNDQNLFIIDQHASDEKFNFEKLNQNFKIKYQRLIAPKFMELSIIDEIFVIDNQQVFENNGFLLEVDSTRNPGSRIKLLSLPISKNSIFTTNDFHELIDLSGSNGDQKNIKCSKIRKILAMRACRSSIMIGQSLTRSKMDEVVKNLSYLDKPWNCPHGRPTMRHLIELDKWNPQLQDYML